MLATLASDRHRHRRPEPEIEHAISRHLRMLRLHAVPYRTGTAFPGHRLLTLSTELATGSAGALLAITAAMDHHSTVLPFIGARDTVGALAAPPP